METINVIIPAKDEANNLAELLPKLSKVIPSDQVYVVDDGSVDDTKAVCMRYGVNVISHPYPKGNGAAIKTGARAAAGDILLFMDGDGQHDPADIPHLLSMLEEGYDMVVGSRNADSQASKARWLANSFYNKFAGWMTEQKVDDLTSGFRVVRASKFREFLYMLPNGFSYPTTSTMAFFRSGYSVGYCPIKVYGRGGKSHIRLFRDGLRFFLIIFRVGTLYSPMKIFLPISASMFGIGLAYYGYTFVTMSRFTNMSALLLTSSIMVFLIGLVSEQISALTYNIKK